MKVIKSARRKIVKLAIGNLYRKGELVKASLTCGHTRDVIQGEKVVGESVNCYDCPPNQFKT